ncbi:LRC20 protein, partial [Cercotrichas coryphoeus]|nr:LRC20 protein [Cercotrichas coryphoeus]
LHKRMGEAVARVARKVNDTVENKRDSLDLANCKLMTFPVGIYKAMRSVSEGIRHISLANNELKSITSRFVTTFSQLTGKGLPLPILWGTPGAPRSLQRGQSTQESSLSSHLIANITFTHPALPGWILTSCALFPEVPTDKLASMALLRSLNLRANPVGPEVRLLVRPLVPFELLLSPEEPIPKA